ncbi:L-dopachrome tautomerase-related protein [candidate division KSB1 bacterium]
MNRLLKTFLFIFAGVSIFITACGENRQQNIKYTMEEFASSEKQWTGAAVSAEGRIFVNYPRWSADVPVSVAELKNAGEVIPYPDETWNNWAPDKSPAEHFVCVQSVYVDRDNYLWILDPGMVAGQGVIDGGAKLLKIDLKTDRIVQKIFFDEKTALKTSYLNDVRVDTKRKFAYITDSGTGAIVVVNLSSGESRRLLSDHASTKAEDIILIIEGENWAQPGQNSPKINSDGIALDKTGEYLYYQALTGRNLYRIKTEFLRDESLSEEELGNKVEHVGESGASDGIVFGPDGNLYLSSLEFNAVRRFTPDKKVEMVVQDPGLKWPDSFAITEDGTIYVTTSQIHLGPNRTEPYKIFKLVPEK